MCIIRPPCLFVRSWQPWHWYVYFSINAVITPFSASMLLVVQKEGHLARKNCGVLVWLSVWSEVQSCIWWCHCHSLSLSSVKSRLALPFWNHLTRVILVKGPLNVCVCVWRLTVTKLNQNDALIQSQMRLEQQYCNLLLLDIKKL